MNNRLNALYGCLAVLATTAAVAETHESTQSAVDDPG